MRGDGAVLIDVRRLDEDAAALPGALRIPPDLLPGRLDELPPDAPLLLACTCLGEATSVRVAHWLRDRGYEAYAVRGGMAALGNGADVLPLPSAEPEASP